MNSILLKVTREVIEELKIWRASLHELMENSDDCWPQPGIPDRSIPDIRRRKEHYHHREGLTKNEEALGMSEQLKEKLIETSLIGIFVKVISKKIGQIRQNDHVNLKGRIKN